MSWEVRVPKRVNKALNKLSLKERNTILVILHDFGNNPWTGDIVKLKGKENMWRRRVGNYRIFYFVDIKTKIVEITEIERRTSSTY